MKKREIRLDGLSKIQFRTALLEEPDDSFFAVSIAFVGRYGNGSLGNGDGRFMVAMAHAALNAWWPLGLILDLRELQYEFGNTILDAINAGRDDDSGDWITPTRLVVSRHCRGGMISLMEYVQCDPAIWLLDTVEDAYEAVRQLASDD